MAESTAINVSATGQSGLPVQTAGPYVPSRHNTVVIFFKRGDKFPLDPVDGRTSSWSMVNSALQSAAEQGSV